MSKKCHKVVKKLSKLSKNCPKIAKFSLHLLKTKKGNGAIVEKVRDSAIVKKCELPDGAIVKKVNCNGNNNDKLSKSC
jgi:hypothetical protein